MVKLLRLEQTPAGTFGRLSVLGLYTCELPWRSNVQGQSCIPAGIYRCVFTHSPRFKRLVYLVGPVPARSGIRIHPANLPEQLNGCVALGEKIGWIGGKRAVLLSAPAVRRLEEYMRGQPFQLEVLDGTA